MPITGRGGGCLIFYISTKALVDGKVLILSVSVKKSKVKELYRISLNFLNYECKKSKRDQGTCIKMGLLDTYAQSEMR